MDRAILVENIQHKVAAIESSEILKELEEMIDEMLLEMDELPIHVQESMTKAKKELNEGKGIPHEQIMNEIRGKYPKIG